MARMWPATLPSWVTGEPRRAAEVKVYRWLAEVLDDSWSVFYSRPWWGIGPRGGEVEGEADFILANPSMGFLFVEVKGGRIAYDPAASRWTTMDKHYVTSNIKDPVSQAMVCKHRYIERLRSMEGWPRGYVRFRHGVVFPDSEAPGAGSITVGGYEKPLFCFAGDFDHDLGAWISARLATHDPDGPAGEVPPGKIGVELLTKLVADPVRLRVPLRRVVEGDMAQFDQLLTGQQLHALSVLEALPRLLIEGGAGTGKTILAIEMAARLADSGKTVCLLCYNDPLASHLERALKSRPNVLVGTFHRVCGLLAREAGIDPGPVGPTFYEDVLPGCAASALQRLAGRRWDAVIVDEGQDFRDHWWLVIELMLADGMEHVLRIFLDTNQALYQAPRGLAERLGATQLPLRHNLRNTKAIARVTEPLYEGPLILPVGPDGEDPVTEEKTFAEVCAHAVQHVFSLVREESLRSSDIAVLCPSEPVAKEIREELKRLRIAVTNAALRAENAVTVDTVRRFKGLEAPVVVLVVDRVAANSRELAYVGVSRAQSRLHVFGEISGTLLGGALGKARTTGRGA